MAQLLMQTEEVEKLFTLINQTSEMVVNNHNAIFTQANQLIPAEWESNSAITFLDRLNDFITRYNAKIDEMLDLNELLATELNQWFETADSFNY